MIVIHNFARGLRGVRIAWQCEEMGLAWRPAVLGYPTPQDYRARYPLGSVPFLEDDGGVGLAESVAMMLYIAQRYGPTPLLPADPAALARTLQLTVASEAAMGGLINPLIATSFVAPPEQKANWTQSFCHGRVADQLTYVEGLLGDREFLVGEALTLADIAVSTSVGLWAVVGGEAPPGLAAHRERMVARPAYARANAAFQPA
jgi:glutathione S-transferase